MGNFTVTLSLFLNSNEKWHGTKEYTQFMVLTDNMQSTSDYGAVIKLHTLSVAPSAGQHLSVLLHCQLLELLYEGGVHQQMPWTGVCSTR